MSELVSAVVVGADRLGNIPDLLKGHNIAIKQHISGRDPSHQKKTLQLPSGTQLLILLTDFLGHNVMKTFRAAAQRSGIRVLACRRSVCSMKQALTQCGYCEACPVDKGGNERPVRFIAKDADGYAGGRARLN
ncbi:DUF2325 domain-containing protein [Pollutimonas bauzanensis]|uniref:DUF2325 domain-containing protein n=1 Tax=Pollutimonas bauzanensis TaxID=658167 RepID=A0A1M5ZW79_9BURK|nr:DUF2325 domain-containing protein [Pollutimonas bauzanensis]SHI28173.1 hypothetical protein SAMN04488135_11931 [Pollutimonas bauzanensis]